MFEKGKYYSYEDIEKILNRAEAKAMGEMEKNMEEARKESGKEENPMGRVAFTMQNIMAMHTLLMVALGKGEE